MSPAARLLVFVRRYQRTFLIGLVTVILSRGGYLLAPKVTGWAIDDLTKGVTVGKLLRWGLLLLAIGLFGGVFRFLMRRILTGLSRDIEYDMRNEFFAHLERLPAQYFQANRTGDLMSRATNDLNAVRMMIGPSVMYLSDTILGFVGAFGVMVSIDWRLSLVALIPLPCVSISVKYFGTAIHKRFEQIQAQLSDLSAVAQEAFAGVRVVRAYGQERDQIARFARSNEEFVRKNRRLIAVQGFFFPSMTLFLGIGAVVVVWYGSRVVITGRITVGQFVAFFGYFTMLGWPMIAFGWVTNMIQRGMASWKRMLEVLQTEPTIRDADPERVGPRAAPERVGPRAESGATLSGSPIRGDIEFRNLTFGFGATPVLHDVTAKITAGQTVALVGPTGSGKSALISLLARLYDPPPGTVFVDGIDVREWPLAERRGAMGFVPQEPFLFSASLGANVAFGFDADPERVGLRADRQQAILAAAAVARLDKDVADFPRGYETMVGERGITLSGGQKQRTELARAIVIAPRIL